MQSNTARHFFEKHMIKINNDFDELLKDFKEPVRGKRKRPFVLFGYTGITTMGSGPSMKDVEVRSLFCLDCHNNHAQPSQITHYVNKGMTIIGYWFPEGEAVKPYVGKFEDGKHPFGELERHIQLITGGSTKLNAIREERDALLAKVAALEEKKRGKGKDE